jgi:hypothetical protein
MPQNIQHGPSSGATGFAIINRSRLPTCHQSPAHMGSTGVLGTQAFNNLFGGGTVSHRLHTAYEPTFLYNQFAVHRG